MFALLGRDFQQTGIWFVVIEIVDCISTGLDFRILNPSFQRSIMQGFGRKTQVGPSGDEQMGTRRVGDDKGMFAVLVSEIIIQASLLHQPTEIVEVSFSVLHIVITKLGFSRNLQLERLQI